MSIRFFKKILSVSTICIYGHIDWKQYADIMMISLIIEYPIQNRLNCLYSKYPVRSFSLSNGFSNPPQGFQSLNAHRHS